MTEKKSLCPAKELCTLAEEKHYSVFKSSRIVLLEQSMTHERGAVGELSVVPGGGVCVSNLCFLKQSDSFKILLWSLSAEVIPFGPKGQQMLSVWRSGMVKL